MRSASPSAWLAWLGSPENWGSQRERPSCLAQPRPFASSIGRSLTPVERTVFDRYVATIRAQLDDATFAVMWAEGQKMTLNQAKAKALGGGG